MSEPMVKADGRGEFIFERVPWRAHQIRVETSNPGIYVERIRFNGQPLLNNRLSASSGGALEVVVAKGAASLVVTVKQGDAATMARVAMVRESMVANPPDSLVAAEPFVFMSAARADGRAEFSGLPPGDYRLVAMPVPDPDLNNPAITRERIARGQRITLDRGEQASIEVQLDR